MKHKTGIMKPIQLHKLISLKVDLKECLELNQDALSQLKRKFNWIIKARISHLQAKLNQIISKNNKN